jgi:hypothetical protein
MSRHIQTAKDDTTMILLDIYQQCLFEIVFSLINQNAAFTCLQNVPSNFAHVFTGIKENVSGKFRIDRICPYTGEAYISIATTSYVPEDLKYSIYTKYKF